MPAKALIQVLEEMVSVHQEILRLSGEKQQVLIAGDIPGLEKIVQAEDRLIRRLAKLEGERQAALRNLCDAYGIAGDGLILSELIEKVDGEPERKRLKELQRELSRLLAELKEMNAMNQELIRQALEFVHYSLELFATGTDSSVIYQNPLDKGNPANQKRSMFDFKV